MNRRQATEADLGEGSIVYKGSGSVEYRIWKVLAATTEHPAYYALQTLTSKTQPWGDRYYTAEDLQVALPWAAYDYQRDMADREAEKGN